MTPKEVLALIREKEVRAVDLRFMDFPGLWQHFTIPAEALDESTSSRKASASTAPASAAGRPSTSPTCSSCPSAGDRLHRSVLQGHDADDDLQHPGPAHQGGLHARSAQRRPQGRQLHEVHRHRRHRLLRPRAGVLRLRRRPLRPDAALRLLLPRQRRRRLEHRPRREAQPRLQAPLQGRLLPRARRPTPCTTSAPR